MSTGKATIQLPAEIKKGEVFLLRFVIIHPMETGTRKDPMTGLVAAAHYITDIELTFNKKKILDIETGTGVSRNPSFGIKMKVNESGKLILKYKDNQGNHWKKTEKIKL